MVDEPLSCRSAPPPPYTSATLVAIAAMRTMSSPAKHFLSGAVAKPERCSQQNSEQRKQTRQPRWRPCPKASVNDDAPGRFGANRKHTDRT
ncbi:unnamed protein product [Sphagnum tenellum]